MIEKLKLVKGSRKEWNHKEFDHIDIISRGSKSQFNILMIYAIRETLMLVNWSFGKKHKLTFGCGSNEKSYIGPKTHEFYGSKKGTATPSSSTLWPRIKRGLGNTIDSIEIEGASVNDPARIKTEADNFFKKIFREESTIRPTFDDMQFNKVNEEQATSIILSFSDEEMDDAVASCDSDKASGSNKFIFKFVKNAWEIIKEDIYEIVQELWNSAWLPRGCNTAYIARISKVANLTSFKEYRPISMVGCIYKIIVKLMARRIQKVMSSLIGPFQSSYIEGRQIPDGLLLQVN